MTRPIARVMLAQTVDGALIPGINDRGFLAPVV
jgi:hypothetical protein